MNFLATLFFARVALASSSFGDAVLVDTPIGKPKCTADEIETMKANDAKFSGGGLEMLSALSCIKEAATPFCDAKNCAAFPEIHDDICTMSGGGGSTVKKKECYEMRDETACVADDTCLYTGISCTEKNECNVVKDNSTCNEKNACKWSFTSCSERYCEEMQTQEDCDGATFDACYYGCIEEHSYVNGTFIKFYTKGCKSGHADDSGSNIMGFMEKFDDASMKKFCTGNCGQSMVDLLGAYIPCLPEELIDGDLPTVSNVARSMNLMCTSDVNGQFCARAFMELEKTYKKQDCSQFKDLGCCLGSVDEAFKLLGGGVHPKFTAEMKRCGIESPPKSCPGGGQVQVTAVATATLGGLSSQGIMDLSKQDLNKLKDEVIKGIADKTGLDASDIQIEFKKSTENPDSSVTAVITMIPKDDKIVDDLVKDTNILGDVDGAQVKELAGAAATGDDITTSAKVEKKDNKSDASKFRDPISGANKIVAGTAALVATALAAL